MSLLASPFHADERAAQRLAGFGASSGAIYDQLTEQHRNFFERLSYVLVGALDEVGWPIATLLTGPPGFVHSPDPATLSVKSRMSAIDPARIGVRMGSDAAILGIDLSTRRRNRANGTIVSAGDGCFSLRIGQAFGNCPKYIHRRAVAPVQRSPGALAHSSRLDDQALEILSRADTFFVASRSRSGIEEPGRVDISHRGGSPGFVTVDLHGNLVVPDYRGNRYFNTLGNLLGDARAALLFVDFERGDLLQVQGRATIEWSTVGAAFPIPADRTWSFAVERAWRRPSAVPLEWRLIT